MPNDCYNTLALKGNATDLKRFKDKHIKTNERGMEFLDFNTVIEEPENVDWFEWRCRNWGTKRNSYDFGEWSSFDDRECSEMNLTYSTAWNSSVPVIKALIAMHPEISFDFAYYECGMEIAGYVKGSNGKIIDSAYYDFDWSDRDFVDFVLEYGLEDEEYVQEMIESERED